LLAARGVNIEAEIWRWVRAFHSALYREFLPADSLPDIHGPSPCFLEGQPVEFKPPSKKRLQLNLAMNNHIKADRFDEITSNNEKLRYLCVWLPQRETGNCECMFALSVNSWTGFADERAGDLGCVGHYAMPRIAPPNQASVASEFPISISVADFRRPI
jgi:hypothetical protein